MSQKAERTYLQTCTHLINVAISSFAMFTLQMCTKNSCFDAKALAIETHTMVKLTQKNTISKYYFQEVVTNRLDLV